MRRLLLVAAGRLLLAPARRRRACVVGHRRPGHQHRRRRRHPGAARAQGVGRHRGLPPGGTASGGLPDVTLPCLGGGRPVDLATLRGPLVVNLWRPVVRAVPPGAAGATRQFHRKHGGQGRRCSASTTRTRSRRGARSWPEDAGVTYPLVADPSGAAAHRRKVRCRRSRAWPSRSWSSTSTATRRLRSCARGARPPQQQLERPRCRRAPRGRPVTHPRTLPRPACRRGWSRSPRRRRRSPSTT